MLTETDRAYLDEVEARCNGATKGPWEVGDESAASFYEGDDVVVHPAWTVIASREIYRDDSKAAEKRANMRFIAAARTDIPRLIAMVRGMGEGTEVVRCKDCIFSHPIPKELECAYYVDRVLVCEIGRGIEDARGISATWKNGYCDEGKRMDGERAQAGKEQHE